MEKILLAIDSLNPDTIALDFACYLGRLTRSRVTGVFLGKHVPEASRAVKPPDINIDEYWETEERPERYEEKLQLAEKHLALFKEGCIAREVRYAVHQDGGVPANELIRESRFADVIVLSAETSFNERVDGVPTGFVKQILKKAECPVIIAPDSFEPVEEIIFAYNGKPSCVFAIKQFTYLFPEFHDKNIIVVQANETGQWNGEEIYKFTEWLQGHYSLVHFEAVKGKPEVSLIRYLLSKEKILLVTGAYGGSELPGLMGQGLADLLIKTVIQPIFVAHIYKPAKI